jgi:hypothetical protein
MNTKAIVAAANARFQERANDARYESWSDDGSIGSSELRFAAVWATGKAWVAADGAVVASVADNKDGRIWGYVASDALDYASNKGGLTDEEFDRCCIAKVSDTMYRLEFK